MMRAEQSEDRLWALLGKYKNFVLIGETGSGKSEISLNLCRFFSKQSDKEIHFFDMDQTKPLFRARDSTGVFDGKRIILHAKKQPQDSPILVSGVNESLSAQDRITIIDVGGGEHGGVLIGQFAERFLSEDTLIIFLINPYRPWSRTKEDFAETKARLACITHLSRFCFAANPNHLSGTTAADVIEGVDRIKEILRQMLSSTFSTLW